MAPTPFGAGGLHGGGERYPLELCRALARHADVELLTFGPQARTWLDPSTLRVRVLRRLGRLGGQPAQPVAPHLLWSLGGADVVHTHHTRSAPSLLAAAAARARRQVVVTTDHGLGAGRWGPLLPALFDRFLTVSHYSTQTLGIPPDDARTIYGGADPVRFAPDPALPRDGVLFVGRITPHKGVDRLIQALPPGASLTVAGTEGHDPQLPERCYSHLLRQLAGGRDVHFAGPASEDDLPELIRRTAVLVLPSVQTTCYGRNIAIPELLGLTVLEAMASGTPVVASRVGGLPEVVCHGETGFLVAPGDVRELRDRLAQLLGDPALARRMGERGRERVLEKFTWEATANRCLLAYDELLRTRPAHSRRAGLSPRLQRLGSQPANVQGDPMTDRPRLDLAGVVLGAPDPNGLAHFYEDLLGWHREQNEPDWVTVAPPDGRRPGLSFQQEDQHMRPRWPAGSDDQQMQVHLDIHVDDLEAAGAYARNLGAVLAEFQPQEEVRVYLDPAGHPFCLFL